MSPVTADREIAKVYARQANRAGLAAVAVVAGGVLATVTFAIASGKAWVGVLGLGVALTATVYTAVGHLQTRAEAGVIRHLAAARDLDTPLDAAVDE